MKDTVTISLGQYNMLKDNSIMNFISKDYIEDDRVTGRRYNVIVDTDKLNEYIMSFSSRCEEIKYTNENPIDINWIANEIVKLAKLKQEYEEMQSNPKRPPRARV